MSVLNTLRKQSARLGVGVGSPTVRVHLAGGGFSTLGEGQLSWGGGSNQP